MRQAGDQEASGPVAELPTHQAGWSGVGGKPADKVTVGTQGSGRNPAEPALRLQERF